MPTVSLTDPSNGTTADANLISNNNSALETLLNGGLDNVNVSPSAALAVSKLAAGSAGQVLTTNGSTVSWGNAGGGDPATTLPGSPVDKQQAILVDSTTAPTYIWAFQYESGISDANKWMFVGGAAVVVEVLTNEDVSGTSYADISTVGPQVTVPRAGVYDIEFGAHLNWDTSVVGHPSVAPKLGSASTSDNDRVYGSFSGQIPLVAMSRTLRKSLSASDVVKLQYKSNNAASWQVEKRWLKITPVRVA